MRISYEPLDRLVEQDTFAEMLALLEPMELIIAALRLEGLSDTQIGAMLGLGRSAVCWHMEQARQRIVEALPELAAVLRDRCQPSRQWTVRRTRPLERGWLCCWDSNESDPLPGLDADPSSLEASLTSLDVARHYGVARQTVARWIRAGHFPHAVAVDAGRGEYRIPEADLIGFRPRRRKRRSAV